MTIGSRFYWPKGVALDPIGVTIPGALLNFYLTESDTRAATFANETLTVANANPVEALAGGVFPDIFLNPAISYRVVFTGPDDGFTPPVEYWTADPVNQPSPEPALDTFFDIPFEFLGDPPGASQILGMFVAVRPQRIFGDFSGTSDGFESASGVCVVAPADGNYVVDVFLNGVSGTAVGSMTITVTTGAFSFATVSGLPIDLDAGDYIAFVGAVTPDSVLQNLAWTVTGINL